MKRNFFNLAFMAMVVMFAASCEQRTNANRDDSKDMAKESNDDKFRDGDTKDDAKFAVEAADGGMLEVQLGELAMAKGTSQEVRNLGKMMLDDHKKANDELKALASQKNITLPASLSDKCQKKYNDLAEKKGQDFDEAYAEFMVKDHKEDLDEFKDQAEKGGDPDLKAWAAAKVPVLEHHLDMAKDAEKMVDEQCKNTGKL